MIKDSGNRRKFKSGAVRDITDGKGRCDLLPLDIVGWVYNTYFDADGTGDVLEKLSTFQKTGQTIYLLSVLDHFLTISPYDRWSDMFLEVSKHFEEGAVKYSEYNWQKGIPTHCYVDSAVRHYLKWLRGDTDEPHDRAFVWNILCCIWTCVHKHDLNDYPIGSKQDDKD